MTVVHNTVVKPDGTPHMNIPIRVVLSWNNRIARVPRHADLEAFITLSYSARTDENGYWEMDLFPGSVLTPAHAVYRVTQRTGPLLELEVFHIDVPDSATPVWVADILTPKPTWEH